MRAVDGWDAAQSRAWLERAGTSPDYSGLYRDVAGFEMPGAEALAAIEPGRDLPELAEVPSLVEAMIGVDGHWDALKELMPSTQGNPPPPLTLERSSTVRAPSA
jgi:hypothetical protein